jgi:hypothetical protein
MVKQNLDDLIKNIEDFKSLEDNWDGDGAIKFSEKILDKAKNTLRYIKEKDIELPDVVSPFSGGIQLEYTKGRLAGTEIEVREDIFLVLLFKEDKGGYGQADSYEVYFLDWLDDLLA